MKIDVFFRIMLQGATLQKIPASFQQVLCMWQDIGENQQIWDVNVQPGTVKGAKHLKTDQLDRFCTPAYLGRHVL